MSNTFRGFLPGDLTITPSPEVSPESKMGLEERILRDQPDPAAVDEARELYEFIDRSVWFDGLMGIDRADPQPRDGGRNSILWAARRHLAGVKLPSKAQLEAMYGGLSKAGV